MSDHTPNPVSFPIHPNHKYLSPEIIAETYGFPLAYHDHEDGNRYYAVQDWISGVAEPANPANFWAMMKKRLANANVALHTRCVKLPYRATNGGMYQMDFADSNTLYRIAWSINPGMGIRNQILGQPATDTKVGTLYLLHVDKVEGEYKIGIAKNLRLRLFDYACHLPPSLKITVEHSILCSNRRKAELILQNHFHSKLIRGEWYRLTDADVALIQSNALISHLCIGKHAEETGRRLGIDIATDQPLLPGNV